MKISKNVKGALLMSLACVCFSIGGVLLKYISWSALSSNGVRTFITALMFAVYMKVKHHKLKVNKTILLAAACSMFVSMFFALSTKNTSAANAIVLQFTAPVFIIVINALFLHKKSDRTELVTCGLVFFGIVLFFFDSMTTGNYLGDFFGLMSGICYAGVFIFNKNEDSDAPSAMLIGYFASAVVGLPFIFRETDFSANTILLLIILGVFQLGAGYLFFSESLNYLAAVPASLMSGLEPILNPILVAIFYPEEKLSVFSICGAAVVLVSIVAYNVIKAKNPEQNT